MAQPARPKAVVQAVTRSRIALADLSNSSAAKTQAVVLVVDDDLETRRLLTLFLQRAGYTAEAAADAEQALSWLARQPADILISDIHLPDRSGFELVQQIRDRALDLEVIVLTGLPEVDSAIQALRIGAADYLTKPVLQDLLLRSVATVHDRLVQARRRRQALALMELGLRQFTAPTSGAGAAPTPVPTQLPDEGTLRVGPVQLDLRRLRVRVGEDGVDVTPSELEILHCLARNSERVVTPQELVKAMRGYQVDAEEAAEMVRPHVSNLRRKLLAASPEADIIITVRGAGYMVRPTGP